MEIYSILLTESCLCNILPNKIKALPTQTFSNLVVIQMTAIKSLSQLKFNVSFCILAAIIYAYKFKKSMFKLQHSNKNKHKAINTINPFLEMFI